jgi:hypothetical protein
MGAKLIYVFRANLKMIGWQSAGEIVVRQKGKRSDLKATVGGAPELGNI